MIAASLTAPHLPIRIAAPVDLLAITLANERRVFFERLGWNGGKGEIVAGTNNPTRPDQIDLITYDKDKGRASTRRWFSPDDLAAMEHHTARLIRQWGNVYISVGSYDQAEYQGKTTWNRTKPRARHAIPLDDVTNLGALRLAPSLATETSPVNFQVVLICRDLLTPPEVEQIAEGAARIEGTDPSAKDAEQIIRIPGSLNTKPKCAGQAGNPATGQEPEGWTVRLRIADGPTYTRAELCRAYAPHLLNKSAQQRQKGQKSRDDSTPPATADPAWIAALAAAEGYRGYLWQDNALWLDGPLLRADGTVKALPPRHQINRVLLGESWADVASEWGHKDPTGSGFEYHLVGALWLVGCPVAQIIAMVEALSLDPQRKSKRWFYHTNLYGCLYGNKGWAVLKPGIPRRPLRTFSPRPATLPTERGPGRPTGQRRAHADRLAELLAERVGEVVKRAQLAELLGVATRMIAYLLADLRAANRLETAPAGTGFKVLRCAINTGAQEGHLATQVFEDAIPELLAPTPEATYDSRSTSDTAKESDTYRDPPLMGSDLVVVAPLPIEPPASTRCAIISTAQVCNHAHQMVVSPVSELLTPMPETAHGSCSASHNAKEDHTPPDLPALPGDLAASASLTSKQPTTVVQQASTEDQQKRRGEWSSCPAPTAIHLATLVREAYDSYPQTGPAKFRAIVAHVGPGYTLDQVRAAYRAEQDRRKWDAFSMKEREIIARLADLTNKQLNAELARLGRGLDLATAPQPTLRPDEPAEKAAARLAAHQRARRSFGLYKLSHRLALAERDRRERAAEHQLALLEAQGVALGAGAYGVDQATLDRASFDLALSAPADRPRVTLGQRAATVETPPVVRPLTHAERCKRATEYAIRQTSAGL